jgi:hypothetical protein
MLDLVHFGITQHLPGGSAAPGNCAAEVLPWQEKRQCQRGSSSKYLMRSAKRPKINHDTPFLHRFKLMPSSYDGKLYACATYSAGNRILSSSGSRAAICRCHADACS